MSRRGHCHDNAVMVSWPATEKSEEGEHFEGYARAKAALFDYIEVFYNQRWRHSTLGQISPAAFERQSTRAASSDCPLNRVKASTRRTDGTRSRY